MEFKIEIDDFYLDEDDDIEAALKSFIISDVVHKITKNIENKVEEQIAKKVAEIVEEKLVHVIDIKLTELIACGMITRHRQEISIIDYVKDTFQSSNGWGNPQKQIERIAKDFGEELKLQYNNAFANKIVQNMKEQGLLKDEVVQILLGGD